MIEILKRPNKPDLAYNYYTGSPNLPTIMFLGGFRSDMMGSKASFLEIQCKVRQQSYMRFDYSGHGQSKGLFEEGSISDWKNDALDILNIISNEPVILVGSSMGGWISLLLAREIPDKISALIGIAAAPDFTTWIENQLNEIQKKELKGQGFILTPSDYGDPYIITKKLLNDGKDNLLLDKPLNITIPVRLLQGKKDKDVPWKTAERIKDIIQGDDVQIYYQEEGNHSLSAPEDLALLNHIIEDIL